jgi:hypothetical protein
LVLHIDYVSEYILDQRKKYRAEERYDDREKEKIGVEFLDLFQLVTASS